MSRQSQRTNLILLAVLGVLGAAAAVKTFFVKNPLETGDTVKASESLFANFKKDQVTALVIDGPEDKKIELQKDGDHWNLVNDGNFRADKGDVERVLNGIEKLKFGKVASSRTDKLDEFNLQKGKAIEVTAYGAGGKTSAPIAAFSIGKAGDDWKFAFVRVTGTDTAIRKVEGSTSDFDPGYDNTWRDKTIFELGDAAKIEEVTITGAKGPVTLLRQKEMGPKDGEKAEGTPVDGDPASAVGSKEEGETHAPPDAAAKPKPEQEVKETYWQITAPTSGKAKKWLGDNIATNLAKLECASFFTGTETPAELGLEPPAFVAAVRREGEKEATPVLYVGNKGKDNKYPVKRPNDPTIWWIDSWKGDYLTKSADELLDAPPPKPDEKKPDEKKPDEHDHGEKHDAEKTPDPAAPAGEKRGDEAPKGDAAPAPAKPEGGDAEPADGAKPADVPKPDDGAKPDGGGR